MTDAARIEQKLDALTVLVAQVLAHLGGAAPTPPATPAPARAHAAPPSAGPIASDDDLDGRYGNPEIRRDPPRWRGESMVGRKFSDCSPEYLDTLAGFNDWRADQDEKKGDPRSKWARLDASRARGWAKRLRDGATQQPAPAAEPASSWDDQQWAGPASGDEPYRDAGAGVDDVPF